MGLTRTSVGKRASALYDGAREGEILVALAGNPNVGKSSIFNALTGMHQHTGNWSGKTVTSASGLCTVGERQYRLVDIPGTYSLTAHSDEESVARDFLLFGGAEKVVVVCDATALERGLCLVLQVLEVTANVILCVNLMDEAARKHIEIDLCTLSHALGIPAVGVSARRKKSLEPLLAALGEDARGGAEAPLLYEEAIRDAIAPVQARLSVLLPARDARFAAFSALHLLLGDEVFLRDFRARTGNVLDDETLQSAIAASREALAKHGLVDTHLADSVVGAIVARADEIAGMTVRRRHHGSDRFDRGLDRIFTGRVTAFPIMLLLFLGIFWLTVSGANIPSAWLSRALFSLEEPLLEFFLVLRLPRAMAECLVFGGYRVLSWVVSVMLPPMAIFFPLFTLLEDAGYLPRIAYDLDRPFGACGACGKQALCMCMGFGCNAAGVVGCRIIDSPRERLLAILTNSFVPCNGKFPTLIALITVFFAGRSSLRAALMLGGIILFGVLATFLATRLLSATILAGKPSSFTIEMPPYRTPQFGRVILRSIFDRTLFVLGRAAAVALPAGILLWLLSNITVGDATLLAHGARVLDPIGRLMGLDGTMLLAFILGSPANEIVLPIALMAYTEGGVLTDIAATGAIDAILSANGWTWKTAISAMLFSLMHFPCSTTLLTIKKETGSIGYTLLAALLPTAFGFAACVIFTALV